MYITATFPFFVIAVVFIVSLTLDGDGAVEGVKEFVLPQWHKLKDGRVWADAASFVYSSMGIGAGGLTVYASYNKFNYNFHRYGTDLASFKIL